MNSKNNLILDIKNHKIIGIGEGSHGTREYQILRIKLIRDIYKKFAAEYNIIVFIEDGYFDLKFMNQLAATKFRDFVKIIKNSNLYDFYKSPEFIILLYYLHQHKIPVFGVDVQNIPENINPADDLEKYIIRTNQKFKPTMSNDQRNAIRKGAMLHIINKITKDYHNPKSIVLAHNYHVSGYENFPGLRIAQYSQTGTVRVANYANGEFQKYSIEKFNYLPKVKKFQLVKVAKNDKRVFQNNSFVLSGEEYDFNKFDYIYMFPKTHAIRIGKLKK